jgi:2,4-dienoyl-CoA reductase-like NADH-dependent reductase (Old Yellow Enzyme family)
VRHRDYYCERAEGGVGLIVTEPTPVHETARIVAANFVVDDDRIVPALAELGRAVRERGAVLVSQLYHVGPHSDPLASLRERWGPSAVQVHGFHDRVHAMTRREVAEVVRAFARAAARVARAGLDGAEVLMAYDTLPDAFMSPLYNRRGDDYGGSLENRLRFGREILHGCREALGDDRVLGITLSGDHFVPGQVSGPDWPAR